MSTVNSNSADSAAISGFLAGSFPDLSRALWRRAGSHFAAAGRWAESAEARLAAGDLQAAAEAFREAGDPARLTPLLLAMGDLEGALKSSSKWLAELARDDERREREEVAARLYRAAALNRSRETLRARRHYLAARRRLVRKPAPDPARLGEEWEALGRYGALVKRPDLVRLGYEKALAVYGRTFNYKRLNCARAYLAEVADDPLLVRDLQERIAAWQPRSALSREREKLFAALDRWSDE